MKEETNPIGNIYISPQAIATITSQATLYSYGVVGLAAKNIVQGLANVLVKEPSMGVDVNFEGEKLKISVYIIVEYGTRIKSVSSSIADAVRYQVEKAIGIPVAQVNVHVRGLRISNPD